MDLRSVDRFLTVAELGSLNKAAQRLNLSQPALSKSIQMLEESLGVPLLDRSPRGISLTSFGESVFAHGRRISAELRRLQSDLDQIRNLGAGEINVGAPLGPDSRTLALAILELVSENARLTINIANGTRGELIRPLLHGDLDFLIATLFDDDEVPPDVEQTELYLDSMVLVVRAEHPVLAGGGVDLPKLIEHPWIALNGARNLEGALHSLVGRDFKKSLLRSGSPMFVKNILVRSDFIGLVRQDAVGPELDRGTIVELDLSATLDLSALLPPQKVGLIYRSDVSLSAASRALIGHIAQATLGLRAPR